MEELKKKFLSPGNSSILLFSLLGLILIGSGIIYARLGANPFKNAGLTQNTKIEVLNSATSDLNTTQELTVEIAGSVEKPGVYKMPNGSRIDDLLVLSGGLSKGANREWVEKYLNRAAKLIDSQKVYIPSQSEVLSANISGVDQSVSSNFSSDSNGLVNINTSSLSELDKLPGIGPVYGQSIIDHRPYSTKEDLVTKGAIKQNVFEKIKDKIITY